MKKLQKVIPWLSKSAGLETKPGAEGVSLQWFSGPIYIDPKLNQRFIWGAIHIWGKGLFENSPIQCRTVTIPKWAFWRFVNLPHTKNASRCTEVS
jgi:hypothetical protein